MKLKTFTATAKFPQEDVLQFAIAKGYIENEEQTADEFIAEFFKTALIDLVGRETIRHIAQEKEQEKIQAVKEVKDRLSQAINVT